MDRAEPYQSAMFKLLSLRNSGNYSSSTTSACKVTVLVAVIACLEYVKVDFNRLAAGIHCNGMAGKKPGGGLPGKPRSAWRSRRLGRTTTGGCAIAQELVAGHATFVATFSSFIVATPLASGTLY
jgi:hypothetical protein